MTKVARKAGAGPAHPAPYPEAVTRLASIRHSLRLVEPSGFGPADDLADDRAIAEALDAAPPARRERFDRRSGALVASASAGVEALMSSYSAGVEPSEEAARELSDRIRRELAEIAGMILS